MRPASEMLVVEVYHLLAAKCTVDKKNIPATISLKIYITRAGILMLVRCEAIICRTSSVICVILTEVPDIALDSLTPLQTDSIFFINMLPLFLWTLKFSCEMHAKLSLPHCCLLPW